MISGRLEVRLVVKLKFGDDSTLILSLEMMDTSSLTSHTATDWKPKLKKKLN